MDVIAFSRRENLPWWGRLLLHYLPCNVYRQVLREHDLALRDLPVHRRMAAMGMERVGHMVNGAPIICPADCGGARIYRDPTDEG